MLCLGHTQVVNNSADLGGMATFGARAIVVDDEPIVRQFLEIALTDLGCQVETFATCEAGLARCENCDFDIAFIDKNLPDGSGLQICERLEKEDCKVALVTGYANLTSAVEALRHGVADYFTKPIDLDDLTARLGRMLHQLELERANRALIQELQTKCAELERVAARDPVTGLFNHTHFQAQLDAEIERSKGKARFSLALFALDRFAVINDQFGHSVGDTVLRQVAELLSGSEVDEGSDSSGILGKQDVACRVGGDTFALILPGLNRTQASARLQEFRNALVAHAFGDTLPVLTASAGIAQYPEDGDNRRHMFSAAERTLSQAKSIGGDSVLCYDAEGDGPRSNAEVRAVRALGACLANRSVRFVYQPIVSVSAQKAIAYEALCRPTAPAYRHVGELLTAAAQTGRIIDLGRVLREVAVQPLSELPQGCSLFLNVNPQELDGEALFDPDCVLHPIAHQIVLEITETEEITDFTAARGKLKELRRLGYRIALDDFGAGYQGFSSLALLEPDYVKLDMAIVRGITSDSRAARLVRHIREFCEAEGIQTIAEGVETEAEFRALRELGLELMQGYLFAAPGEAFCPIRRSVFPAIVAAAQ
jgi:diguanylate cyclase (GGDEF)-like protein